MDVLWLCISTLTVGVYSMLHLNVPAPNGKLWTVISRKLRWAFLGLLAPEVPMLFACGQCASAQRSVQAMRSLGFDKPQWTVEHGFFADSGGFWLHASDFEAFPITAKQLEYLVRHKHIRLPSVSSREIWDKSNADYLAKAFACYQTLWLAVQLIGRGIQQLPITPLELATIAIAGCSLTTQWFWLKKPLDVETSITLNMERSIAEVFKDAGESCEGPFLDTPLDFIEPETYMSSKWSRTAFGWIQRWGLQTRPMKRIPDDRDPQPCNMRQHVLLGIATATFASIHLLGWNFSFPTGKESILWRANSLVMWGLLAVYGTAEVVICRREGYKNLGLDTLGAYKRRWPACLWFFIPAFLYMATRVIVIFESLWSMRSLPNGAFQTVQWAEMAPHL